MGLSGSAGDITALAVAGDEWALWVGGGDRGCVGVEGVMILIVKGWW
jgi:hypothetical protein